jgi:DNA-binding PucR family transcriptional regulator
VSPGPQSRQADPNIARSRAGVIGSLDGPLLLNVSPTRRDVVRTAAECLRPHLDEIADEMAATIHKNIPQLGDDPALVTETRASALATASHFLALVRDEIDHREVQLPLESTHMAREFVHLGGNLAGLMQALRLGHEILWTWWLNALRDRCADPVVLWDAVELASHMQFAYMDTVSSRLADEYMIERERWARSAEAVRVDTVRAILDMAQSPADPDLASARLGYELRRQHLGFVVSADAAGEQGLAETRRLALGIAEAVNCPQPLLVPLGGSVLGGWIGGSSAADLEALNDLALAHLLTNGVHVAIGTLGNGVAGFRRTHVEATHARKVAVRARRPGHVTRYATVALASLACADIDQARGLVHRELGPLARGDDETLRLAATLRVYLEEGSSLERAARRLGVHKNTINRRVRRAQELLGRPLEERTLELQVALAVSPLLSAGDDGLDTDVNTRARVRRAPHVPRS